MNENILNNVDTNSSTTYSSFDLMKIFNIKKGSWNNIKTKLSLDSFASRVIENGKIKYLYNGQAFSILENYYKENIKTYIGNDPSILPIIQENILLKNTIDEYKHLNNKFELMYEQERKRVENFIEVNTDLKNKNNILVNENKNIQLELTRIKNRSFFDRLINKF